MVDSILAKFELRPIRPAVTSRTAAVAFQHKNEKEAKDLLAAAEKEIFSGAEQNVCRNAFMKSGWMQKAAGQTRVGSS